MTNEERQILAVMLDELRQFREETNTRLEDVTNRLGVLEETHIHNYIKPNNNDSPVSLDLRKIGIILGIFATLSTMTTGVVYLTRFWGFI